MRLIWAIAGSFLFVTATYAQTSQQTDDSREQEIRSLRKELEAIAARLDALENTKSTPSASEKSSSTLQVKQEPSASVEGGEQITLRPEDATTLDFFRGTTINFGIDGYYGYNFNQPIGRVNLLRAYDVTSNSFSINQANIMIEHLPGGQSDNRFGGRLDLQFGQATETLQGSPTNEQRPQVWRNVFQAYGSYLAPLGNGLELDFGKFASSLGAEGNYTKDQIAYSRSYTYTFLPYYHMGLRAIYNLSPKINFTYWLINGAQQTEDFNGFKSQGFLFVLKPASTLSWNINYYFGQEERDVAPTIDPGLPNGLPQPGLPKTNISPAPNGRTHIFDSYATWNVTQKLTVMGEADYEINRQYIESQSAHAAIGALYVKYSLPSNWSFGTRFEYFDDRNALFSGKVQALKELTLIADHRFAPGFLARAEYRRDFSNQHFFLTDTTGRLSRSQTTATLGLVYWWGTKRGSW